ncbi:MAG: RDD family protein [Planctomycetota bacterium]
MAARVPIVVLLCSLAAALVASGAPAWAQPSEPDPPALETRLDVGVGAVDAGGTAHAWGLITEPGRDRPMLFHMSTRGAGRAEAGTQRIARRFPERPIAIAARENEVAFAFEPLSEGAARRVESVVATATRVGGVFAFAPAKGVRPLAPLPGEGRLLGLAGSALGYAALLADDDRQRLLILRDGLGASWEEAVVPGGDRADVVVGDGRELFMRVDGRWLVAGTSRPEDPVAGLVWREIAGDAGTAPDGTVLVGTASGASVLAASGRLYGVERSGSGTVSLRAFGGGAAVGFETPVGVGDQAVVAPLPMPSDRVMLVVRAPQVDDSTAYVIEERSLATGRLWYSGPVNSASPISPSDVRWLSVALLAMTAAAVLVAVRPSGDDDVYALPDGASLAEPGRRLASTSLDLALVLLAVARISGAGIDGVIGSGALLGQGLGLFGPVLLLGAGAVYGAVFESAIGATPGKLLTGCRVVRVGSGGARRLDLGRSLLRNLIKWGLPPVSMLALLGGAGRHRGDSMAGAAVVVPDPEEPGESPDNTG